VVLNFFYLDFWTFGYSKVERMRTPIALQLGLLVLVTSLVGLTVVSIATVSLTRR
jgi:hypothetical protein